MKTNVVVSFKAKYSYFFQNDERWRTTNGHVLGLEPARLLLSDRAH